MEPLDEIRVDNAGDYLRRLAFEGELTIKFYPERFCIAEDDMDLVEKALRMYQRFGKEALAQVREFHPQLLGRVMKAIKEQK